MKGLIILFIFLLMSGIVLAVYSSVEIYVGVTIPENHSYTKAFDCRQDYYIECQGSDLINVTPIGDPILLETNNSEWCS
jgi:hypothetical protein